MAGPVGTQAVDRAAAVLTAVLGGGYLLWRLYRDTHRGAGAAP